MFFHKHIDTGTALGFTIAADRVLIAAALRKRPRTFVGNKARSEMKTKRNICTFCCDIDTGRRKLMAQSPRILQILRR
jgi:hypothetical protein